MKKIFLFIFIFTVSIIELSSQSNDKKIIVEYYKSTVDSISYGYYRLEIHNNETFILEKVLPDICQRIFSPDFSDDLFIHCTDTISEGYIKRKNNIIECISHNKADTLLLEKDKEYRLSVQKKFRTIPEETTFYLEKVREKRGNTKIIIDWKTHSEFQVIKIDKGFMSIYYKNDMPVDSVFQSIQQVLDNSPDGDILKPISQSK